MTADIDITIAAIAREHLGIDQLEPRNRDRLDFHELSVTQIRRALTIAYHAGKFAAARDKPEIPS